MLRKRFTIALPETVEFGNLVLGVSQSNYSCGAHCANLPCGVTDISLICDDERSRWRWPQSVWSFFHHSTPVCKLPQWSHCGAAAKHFVVHIQLRAVELVDRQAGFAWRFGASKRQCSFFG